MINYFRRYQSGLRLLDLYPITKNGLCACGCGSKLPTKRKRWASTDCQEEAVMNFLIVKGDIFTIRGLLFQIQEGYCQSCGVYSCDWEADHIIPVWKGGGACGLDNFQTLCKNCHREKNYIESHLSTISSHAVSISSNLLLTADGAIVCESLKQSYEIQSFKSTTSSSAAILDEIY